MPPVDEEQTTATASLADLEKLLGHRFADRALLETALSHPSYSYEHDGGRGNERLEFLGDAVLDLVVSERLYRTHPNWREGELTRARAALVNTRALAERSRKLGFTAFLRLGKTERRTGGVEKDSILGNLFEALVGAVYLDGGLAPAAHFIEAEFGEGLSEGLPVPERDVKTRFQEWAHAAHHCTPTYRMLSDSGLDDDPERFCAEVWLGDGVVGKGRGRTKRLAERAAAEAGLVATEESDD